LVIANSRAGSEYAVAQGFPKSKLEVIPNGIDINRFRVDKTAGQQFRADWGIPAASRVIGIVGRLDPMKDHYTFLTAVGPLLLAHPNWHVLCVGDGPSAYREELQTIADKGGYGANVTWTGPVQSMTAAYNALDVLVSSSYGEGFPNVLGEAMACAVPCVATDVGDSTLIIGPYGKIVPPRQAEALRHAIATTLDAVERNEIDTKCCRSWIEDRYSVAHLHRQTVETLQHLVESGLA
jgi:glycosyltransferase involved in cell wall biosynthesis